MVISTKDFELPQQMQHESWSQWIDVCKCDVSSLVQAVQKITICALHYYFQCVSGIYVQEGRRYSS